MANDRPIVPSGASSSPPCASSSQPSASSAGAGAACLVAAEGSQLRPYEFSEGALIVAIVDELLARFSDAQLDGLKIRESEALLIADGILIRLGVGPSHRESRS